MSDARSLADKLMRADSSAEVVALLEDAGYWDDETLWRPLGDTEMNWSSIGNQQSEAISSLVEKITNSIDARLMNACLEHGIDPESSEAPSSMREAVARFFEGVSEPSLAVDGRIASWTEKETREAGKLLTVTATGHKPSKGNPCISIADRGEGQTPDTFPETFMSLLRGNKNRIPFVQGKYNMGGTGALNFCASPHRLQLIISRRNPALLGQDASRRDHEWGFTIVRRQEPRDHEKNSVFKYLAPVRARKSGDGEVLSFAASSWPIFPEANGDRLDPFARRAEYGSLIKLYEYYWIGNRSTIASSETGLSRTLDLSMMDPALPIGVYECRNYGGRRTPNLRGIVQRLDRDKAKVLESGFPRHMEIVQSGCRIPIRVFAFRQEEGNHYRPASYGVVMTINGQAHAVLPSRFFGRNSVGMDYISDSLLVIVDCTALDGAAREELFMNSRDRLRKSVRSESLVKKLELVIANDPSLRELRVRRRKKQTQHQLDETHQSLGQILTDLIEKNPELDRLLDFGKSISSPFTPGTQHSNGKSDFEGTRFPTFFHFRKRKADEELVRNAEMGRGIRLEFQTDAQDDYFGRDSVPGNLTLSMVSEGSIPIPDYRLSALSRGTCSLTMATPEGIEVEDISMVEVTIDDVSRVDPFRNLATFTLTDTRQRPSGPPKPSPKKAGLLSDPKIHRVRREQWTDHRFDDESAIAVKHSGDDGSSRPSYDFFVNVDNKYLLSQQKETSQNPSLVEARFVYPLVLFAMALLNDPKLLLSEDTGWDMGNDGLDREYIISAVGRALARVLLPVLNLIDKL